MKHTIDGRKISHKMFSTESVEWVFSLMLMHKLIGKYVATFFSRLFAAPFHQIFMNRR